MNFYFVLWILFYSSIAFAQNANPTILLENENAEEKAKKYIFCKIELNKKRAYVNEPIVVSYKLYSALESSSFPLSEPSINNSSAYALPAKQEATTVVINNVTFNMYELKKLQIYSGTPGIILIDRIKIRNEVLLKKRIAAKQITDLNDMMQRPEAYIDRYEAVRVNTTIETLPEQIEILPHPANSPDAFTGAVGDFALESYIDKKVIASNEPLALHYKISGKGNFPMINSLPVSLPDAAEKMEPEIISSTDNRTVPISGFKLFNYTMVFKDSGSYVIPAFNFVFFNPATQSYKTIKTDSIVVKVNGASQKKEISAQTTNGTKQLYNYFNNTNLILGAILVSGVLIYFLFKRKRKKTNTAIPKLPEEVENSLPDFEKTEKELFLQNESAALANLRAELLKAIALKKGFPVHSTSVQIQENLKDNPDAQSELKKIIEAIDLAIYGGGNAVNHTSDLLIKAKKLVGNII